MIADLNFRLERAYGLLKSNHIEYENAGDVTRYVHIPDNISVPLDREKVISDLRDDLREAEKELPDLRDQLDQALGNAFLGFSISFNPVH